MTAMKNFTLWLLDNIPDFLMSEPIVYFVGIFILAFIVKILLTLFGVGKGAKY